MTKMTKKSIHLSGAAEQYIADRTAQAEKPNLSAHINNAFEQLAHLARAEKPELSKAEWIEIYNVYAGSDLTRIALPLDLADNLQTHYGTLPQELGGLYQKLSAMTQAQQFAAVDAVRVFWASGADD